MDSEAIQTRVAGSGDRAVREARAAGLLIPEEISGYRIVRLIATGGMGSVFEAEQSNPRRTVALKVIKPGTATPVTLRRFEFEAHVLGLLNHPSVARVYEAGTWESPLGPQPWMAMEYVRGETLSAYARRESLTMRQKLEILATVADAVDHAHQRGVIHRDLKPGNIMMAEGGRPVVLDFGLARATDSDLQAASMHTEAGQIMGTLYYMSPEQAEGLSETIDIRCDVYALGVIAYEFLTGRHPHELKGRGLPEIMYRIQSADPAPMSSFGRVFRGDLETILSKAMEKYKERRYASAGDFARDIRRYLNNEPIAARGPGAAYQMRKFARRNPAVVAGVLMTSISLVAGVIGFAWKAREAAAERDQARAARADAERLLTESREARAKLEAEQYVSNVQLARVRLDAGLKEIARTHLLATAPRLRHWEWGYLMARASDDGDSDAGRRILARTGATATEIWMGIERPRREPVARGPGRMGAIAVSKDGERVAFAFLEGLLMIARRGDATAVVMARTEFPPITRLAFGAGETRVIGLEKSMSSVGIWDAKSGEKRATWTRAGFDPLGSAVAPDGEVAHAWSEDGRSVILSIEAGEPVCELQGAPVPIFGSVFTTGSTRVAAACGDGMIRVWSARTGELVETRTFGLPADTAHALFSGDGARMLAQPGAGDGASVRLVDGAGGKVIATLDGEVSGEAGARFSRDGTAFLLNTGGREIVILDSRDGSILARLDGWPGIATVADFGPEGDMVAVGFSDGRVEFLLPVNPEAGGRPEKIRAHDDIIYDLAFSPDGNRIVTGSYDGLAKIWDAETRTELLRLEPDAGEIIETFFSPDGTKVCAAGWGGGARVWDVETGELLQSRQVNPNPGARLPVGPRSPMFLGPSGLERLAWSPDGRRIIGPAMDHSAIVFDTVLPETEFRVEHPAEGIGLGFVLSAGFSPDGSRVVTASMDRTARVWDAESGAELLTLDGHENFVGAAIYSPQGEWIATISLDRTVRLWDAETGEQLHVFRSEGSAAQFPAYRPDGKALAVGYSDGTVVLYDLPSGDEIRRLSGHSAGVFKVVFSPDGERIMTVSEDGTIKVRDAEGTEHVSLDPGAVIADAVWSPDARRIAASTRDGHLHVWDAADWRAPTKIPESEVRPGG